MDSGVEGNQGAEPLERDGPDGRKADPLQRVGVSDDLVADQNLSRSGIVGDPGRDVDGAAEVVAVLEYHRAAVQADPGLRQADLRDAIDQLQPAPDALRRRREVEHHAVTEQLHRTAAAAVGELVDDLDQPAGQLGRGPVAAFLGQLGVAGEVQEGDCRGADGRRRASPARSRAASARSTVTSRT